MRELKERQTEIALRIEQHQNGKGDFRTTLEGLISLASRAADLFERSKIQPDILFNLAGLPEYSSNRAFQ